MTTLVNTIVTVKDGYKVNSNGERSDERSFPEGRYHIVAQFSGSEIDDEVAEFCGATVGQSALYSMTLRFDFTGTADERKEAFVEKLKSFKLAMKTANKWIELSTISVAELCGHDGYKPKGTDYEVRTRNVAHWKNVSVDTLKIRMKASISKQIADDLITWVDDEDQFLLG